MLTKGLSKKLGVLRLNFIGVTYDLYDSDLWIISNALNHYEIEDPPLSGVQDIEDRKESLARLKYFFELIDY